MESLNTSKKNQLNPIMEQKKGKPGRKKKLSKLSDQDYEQISQWAGDGLNESQIATLLGCSISTITREKKRNEQFEHAIKKGRYTAVQKVANKVFQNAMDGKETSAIFFLKNRDPDNWADKQEVQHQLNLANVLNDAHSRIIEGKSEQVSINRGQFLQKKPNKDQ
jgi:IS30 family transposase